MKTIIVFLLWVAVSQSQTKTVTAKFFLQGFYNPSSNTTVTDTVTGYLYTLDSIAPGVHLDSVQGVFNSSGVVVFIFDSVFVSPYSPHYYYLGINHRNHVLVWTSNLIHLEADTVSYNFTTGINQVFSDEAGPNQFLQNGRAVIYGGDVNKDFIVDIEDVALVENDSYNFVTGYVPTDINGDGFVGSSDLAIVDNNSLNLIYTATP